MGKNSQIMNIFAPTTAREGGPLRGKKRTREGSHRDLKKPPEMNRGREKSAAGRCREKG